jgi:cobyrinic acid a,c-diamide synthase
VTARALIIAAPRSGSGKTTITLGVLAALRRRGIAVRAAKAGPDYIDPAFHAAATGLPGFNLDSWAMPPPLIEALLGEATGEAEILVIEGAMGLFDGVPGLAGRSGAAADLAGRFAIPVLLVLDVSGQSQSAAAIVRGFAAHDPAVRVAGVVLNRVASERHRSLVSDAIAQLGIPVVGSVPRDETLVLPERHLGLVQAAEHADLAARLDRLAAVAEQHIDLDAVLRIACAPTPHAAPTSPRLRGEVDPPQRREGGAGEGASPGAETFDESPSPRPSPREERGEGRGEGEEAPSARQDHARSPSHSANAAAALAPPGRRIALASDAAFSFIYTHLVESWRRAGAVIVCFSPLADEPPPDDCDVCWLPGGYPELHAGPLAAALRFHEGLRTFAERRPVHGECGGYMVMGESLEDSAGLSHRMTGLLGHTTSFAKRKLNLGYRQARLLAASPIGPAGATVRGHEFHYATFSPAPADEPLVDLRDAQGRELGKAGSRRGHVTGTFFHAIARG